MNKNFLPAENRYLQRNDLQKEANYTSAFKKYKEVSRMDKCKVCYEKKPKIHQRNGSCKACRNFFERAIKRNDDFFCFDGNHCESVPDSRNKCKACRFRRCQKIGLKYKKSHVSQSNQYTKFNDDVYSNQVEKDPKNFIELIFLRNTKILTQNIPVYNNYELENINNYFINDLNRVLIKYIDYKGKEIASMIDFLKNLPGTKELFNTYDFNVLIEKRFFVYFIIKHSGLIFNNSSCIQLSNHVTLTKFLFERICDVEIVNTFYNVSMKLNSLSLTLKEIALLLPVALTLPDEKFINKNRISSLHLKYSELLIHALMLNKRGLRFHCVLKEILELIPKIVFI